MKLKIFILVLLSTNAFSYPLSEEDIAKLPKLNSGAVVVPESEISSYKEFHKSILASRKKEKLLGYNYTKNSYTKELLDMGKNGASGINNNSSPNDTHMKYNLSSIQLAFNFKELSFVDKKDIIGFSMANGYHDKQGWDGVAEFFNYPDIGTCVYTLLNMKLSHGGVKISEEIARYDINKKITEIRIEGNKDDGFMYRIYWYDKIYDHELECANMIYDPKIKNDVINLAIKIDKETYL